jgi:hypothetical protein
LNCTPQPCKTTVCDPRQNNGTGGCNYVPTVCNATDRCYLAACIGASCVPKAVCNPNITGCCPTNAPTIVNQPTIRPTTPPSACFNSTGGLGCGTKGICNSTTGKCVCVPGYTGVICQFPPGTHECDTDPECDDSDLCTRDSCVNFTCKYLSVNCSDGDACTTDTCDRLLGCLRTNKSCNDNDGCTNDYCNITSGQCFHTNRSCAYLNDACNIAYCDSSAPTNSQCFTYSVVCPRKNNCTIAFCLTNATNNKSGCTNQTLDCSNQAIAGIVAGITAGVIAAIVLAALACAALAGGGAYAVSNAVESKTETEVMSNPLYCASGESGMNPLHSGM